MLTFDRVAVASRSRSSVRMAPASAEAVVSARFSADPPISRSVSTSSP
jgi:hypothetical protein